MTLRYSKVHLGVADKGRTFLCDDLWLLAFTVESHILEVEFLLVDGGRGKQGRLFPVFPQSGLDGLRLGSSCLE